MMAGSANTYTVKLTDGREVCFSYRVAVAAFIPGRGYVKTAAKYSPTTSKHANQYAGTAAKICAPDQFERLIAPVAVRQ
jgi:hypothetical protein